MAVGVEGQKSKARASGLRLLAFSLIALTLLPYVLMVGPDFFLMEGGSAHYLVLARSISSGQGISEVYLPDPSPHTKTPFMFPLMLSVLDLAFGYNMIAARILLLVFVAAAAFFIYFAVRMEAAYWIALSTACLSLLSPLMLSLMRRVLTEIPYTALSFACLFLCSRIIEKRRGFRGWAALSVLFFAALFTRTIAFTLVAAFIAALVALYLRDRSRRLDMAYGLAAIVPALAGSLWWALRGVRARGSAGLDYLSELFVKTDPFSLGMGALDLEAPLRPALEKAGLADLAHRLFEQAEFFTRTLVSTIDPWLNLEEPLRWHALLIALLAALTLSGMAALLKRRKILIPLYTLGFLFVICIWPYRDPRFVIPAIPLIIYQAIFGGAALTNAAFENLSYKGKYAGHIRIFIVAAAFAWISFNNLIDDISILRGFQRPDSAPPGYAIASSFRVRADTDAREWLLSALAWVRENTDPDAVVMFHSPRVVFLITDRKCVSVPATRDITKFWNYVDRNAVDYIILDDLYREIGGGANLFTPEFLIPALNTRNDAYESVYRFPGTQTAVLKVKKSALSR